MASRAGRNCLPAFGQVPQFFLIEPVELVCTHSTKDTIKVMDDIPFKEQFRQIPLPLVEEVWNHLREMLESGAIQPSQHAWCNAVVLVRKKDTGLWFCINFCCLNACMKKDSYTPLRIQEELESLVGAGHFLYLDLKSQFWQIKMEEVSKQYTTLTVGNLGFFECNHVPLWAVQCTSHVSEADAKVSQWVKSHLLPHLLRWHNCFLMNGWGTSPQIACGLQLVQGV